jgi:hypothetical protein
MFGFLKSRSIIHEPSSDEEWPSILAISTAFPAFGSTGCSSKRTVPNMGSLVDSIRWARRNGMNLDFLKQRKTQGQ